MDDAPRDRAPAFDAVVLAGGSGRRLGGADKPQLRVGAATLLDRVLAAVSGARRVVVVGPPQPVSFPVRWAREDPPGGGPVAALAAALALTDSPAVLVLAADLPWIAPAVPALLDALGAGGAGKAGDVAQLADARGRPNHLAAAWRRPALAAALARLAPPAGRAMRELVADRTTALVADPGGWGADCDTWDDLAAARARADRA